VKVRTKCSKRRTACERSAKVTLKLGERGDGVKTMAELAFSGGGGKQSPRSPSLAEGVESTKKLIPQRLDQSPFVTKRLWGGIPVTGNLLIIIAHPPAEKTKGDLLGIPRAEVCVGTSQDMRPCNTRRCLTENGDSRQDSQGTLSAGQAEVEELLARRRGTTPAQTLMGGGTDDKLSSPSRRRWPKYFLLGGEKGERIGPPKGES